MATSVTTPSFSSPQLGLPSWAWILIGMGASSLMVVVVHGVCTPGK